MELAPCVGAVVREPLEPIREVGSDTRSQLKGTQGTTAPIQGADLRDFREPVAPWSSTSWSSVNHCSHTRSQLKGTQGTTAPMTGADLRDFRSQRSLLGANFMESVNHCSHTRSQLKGTQGTTAPIQEPT